MAPRLRIAPPPPGKLYLGVFAPLPENTAEVPARCDRNEQDPEMVRAYLDAVSKAGSGKLLPAWITFANNWGRCHDDGTCRRFPREICDSVWDWGQQSNDPTVADHHAVPYIRLKLQSKRRVRNEVDNDYLLADLVNGKWDPELRQWARDAAAFGNPLLVSWGEECNGKWKAFNAKWHGHDQPASEPGYFRRAHELYQKTYRHIVDLMDKEGAENISWVFHINHNDNPREDWNRFEHYFPDRPGTAKPYVSMIAVSVYGSQAPVVESTEPDNDPDGEQPVHFRDLFRECYGRIRRMAPGVPIIISELGCSARLALPRRDTRAPGWAAAALSDLFPSDATDFSEVVGFCWWNETWTENGEKVVMNVKDNPALGEALADILANKRDHVQQLALVEP